MSNEVQARIVNLPDGTWALHDPAAYAVFQVVESMNRQKQQEAFLNFCDLNRDRVPHFLGRIQARGMSPDEVVIVLLEVDDVHGGPLAEALMPGHNWQPYRDRGEMAVARGLAVREGVLDYVNVYAPDLVATAKRNQTDTLVIVMAHGVTNIFYVPPGTTHL